MTSGNRGSWTPVSLLLDLGLAEGCNDLRESRKLDRWHRSVKSECLRPGTPLSLADVDDQAFRLFEANRRLYGGFLLLMQTSEWEFLTGVEDADDRTIVGAVLARSMPMPPAAR